MSTSRAACCGGYSHLKLVFEEPFRASEHSHEFIISLPVCKHTYKKTSSKRPFTFTTSPFPFNLDDYPASRESWSKLASSVHDWLENSFEQNKTDEWQWAVNFFWICYLGSSPQFPAVTSPDIKWNPDIVPISGEFINTRSMLMALGQHVPHKRGAQLIAHLVEWMELREKWIMEGVDIEEYQRRIGSHEYF